ncbi:MAG: hypothetical protein PHF86_02910 [Candidatus Nanoarchaeia archaeon]|jgi:hypothetical protein|nr:hypothetical protein [Candidatus Nanoarchaeia archaeon]
MKPKLNDMIEKVHDALITNEYLTAKELSKKCGLKPCSIYRIIRKMRLSGVGVHPTKKGYVLSEFATKSDDVGFIRRCYGRRSSDFIAIQASLKDINLRWKSVPDKNSIKTMLFPLNVDPSSWKGSKILLSYKNSKGI